MPTPVYSYENTMSVASTVIAHALPKKRDTNSKISTVATDRLNPRTFREQPAPAHRQGR